MIDATTLALIISELRSRMRYYLKSRNPHAAEAIGLAIEALHEQSTA